MQLIHQAILGILTSILLVSTHLLAQPVTVSLTPTTIGWQLYRAQQPYFIKGAGGNSHFKELKEAGGNSIRTWSANDAHWLLDSAQRHGLTVTLGLWLQHERHGFDYSDSVAVQQQLEKFTAIIRRYKDHPALLMWAVGNEVDLFYTNTAVWDAVQDIAAMIHQLDPHHPTTTITAGLDGREVQLIQEKAPDIDIYGINTYGAISQVASDLQAYGWEGPYLVAEWGPNGHWEVPKTTWGAPLEPSSYQKARDFDERYPYIAQGTPNCVGSYVFYWGQKQEVTPTWYGTFSESGQSTEALDVLQYHWKGFWPANRAPELRQLSLMGLDGSANIYLAPHTLHRAKVQVKDPEGETLRILWQIMPERTEPSIGGDPEPPLPPLKGLIHLQDSSEVQFRSPSAEGPYRLYVQATDEQGKVAYANIPFYVAHKRPTPTKPAHED